MQIDARMQRPEDFGRHHRRAQGAAPARCRRRTRSRRVSRRRAGDRQPGALQRPAHAAAVGAEVAGREHHRGGRRPATRRSPRCEAQLPPGIAARADPRRLAPDPRRGGERAAHADRRRAADRADRVPVPELLALDGHHRADAADRADRHLPVHVPVRLHHQHDHADGAVAVRGPADRRRDRGAREHRAPCADGQDAATRPRWTARRRSAWRCWPPRFSIVAVFLPIGFMGGIIGKFFHEFGITIVAAVLISMFVSFTLDPMLSSIWHDPAIDTHGQRTAPRRRSTTGPSAASPAGSTAPPSGWPTATSGILRWSLAHKLATRRCRAGASSSPASSWCRCWAPSSCPRPTSPRPQLNFYTPVGSSLEVTEAKARQVEAIVREFPEVRYTLATINTGNAQGKIYALGLRAPGRPQGARAQRRPSCRPCCASGWRRCPASPSRTSACSTAVGGNKQVEFSLQGPDLKELERLSRAGRWRSCAASPAWSTSTPASSPTSRRSTSRCRRDAASDLGLTVAQIASALRTLVAGQTVGNWRAPDDQTYDVNVRLAPDARNAPQRPGAPALRHRHQRRRQRRASCA